MIWLIYVLFIVSWTFGDTVTSLICLNYCEEGNPLMRWLFDKFGEIKVTILYKIFGTIFGSFLYFYYIRIHLLYTLLLFPAIIGGFFCIFVNIYMFYKTKKIIKEDEDYCRIAEEDIFTRIHSRIEKARSDISKEVKNLINILEE